MEYTQDENSLKKVDLDALLPVRLVPHDERWKEWAKEELSHLKELLGEKICVECHHIGSTAIDKIMSKPSIDLLIETPIDCSYDEIREVLEADAYMYISRMKIERYDQDQMALCKGFEAGKPAERRFFLHIHRVGDMLEAVFRDYLNRHDDVAKKYEQLKVRSAEINGDNFSDYCDSKSRFVGRTYDDAIMELVDLASEEAMKIPPRLFPISDRQMFESLRNNTEILDPFGRSTGLAFVHC